MTAESAKDEDDFDVSISTFSSTGVQDMQYSQVISYTDDHNRLGDDLFLKSLSGSLPDEGVKRIITATM